MRRDRQAPAGPVPRLRLGRSNNTSRLSSSATASGTMIWMRANMLLTTDVAVRESATSSATQTSLWRTSSPSSVPDASSRSLGRQRNRRRFRSSFIQSRVQPLQAGATSNPTLLCVEVSRKRYASNDAPRRRSYNYRLRFPSDWLVRRNRLLFG